MPSFQDSIASLVSGDIPALLYNDPSDGGDGSYVINPEKSGCKWSWQPGRFNNQFPYALTPNQEANFSVKVTPEAGNGDTEVVSFMLTSTGRVGVQPYLPMLDKSLSNIPICDRLMFGTAQLPAVLPQTVYSTPAVDWTLTIKDLTGLANTISPVFFGRRFSKSSDQVRQIQAFSRFMHPYWLGPTTGVTGAGVVIAGGPEITLAAGASVTLTYPVPGDAAFDCRWILDDSTSTTGSEPVLTAQIFEGDTGPPLNDVAMSWRDFLACPAVSVTGFPSGAYIRAASLGSPGGTWSHLFEKSTKIRVTFTSADAGTITLRTCFAGVLVYAPELLESASVGK